jgi:pyridoxamine 5'-phosphate oxidase
MINIEINQNSDPFYIFNIWIQEAKNNPNIVEPTAMCLSTVDINNCPQSRMVLLKKYNETGFYFYTNLNSKKAHELKNNKNVALCFYWGALRKQVRITGNVEDVDIAEAQEYFASRNRQSQIGAWSSKQSQPMKNWEEFTNRIDEFTNKFSNKPVPKPDFWSGFRVIPNSIEFWIEGDNRIHQRYYFLKNNNNWNLTQLYP